MLFSGAKEYWFVTSDGTESNMSSFIITWPMKQRLLGRLNTIRKDLKEYSPAKMIRSFKRSSVCSMRLMRI